MWVLSDDDHCYAIFPTLPIAEESLSLSFDSWKVVEVSMYKRYLEVRREDATINMTLAQVTPTNVPENIFGS